MAVFYMDSATVRDLLGFKLDFISSSLSPQPPRYHNSRGFDRDSQIASRIPQYDRPTTEKHDKGRRMEIPTTLFFPPSLDSGFLFRTLFTDNLGYTHNMHHDGSGRHIPFFPRRSSLVTL